MGLRASNRLSEKDIGVREAAFANNPGIPGKVRIDRRRVVGWPCPLIQHENALGHGDEGRLAREGGRNLAGCTPRHNADGAVPAVRV
jgi:hypothetical protein